MITIMTRNKEKQEESVGASRTVRVKRPWRKKLGKVAIVALERNPGNGHIVNQEWWDLPEFTRLVESVVEDSSVRVEVDAYRADRIPGWMRWFLGGPERFSWLVARPYIVPLRLSKAVGNRLREDRN